MNIVRPRPEIQGGRTDGRFFSRTRNPETRRDELENFGRLFGRLSSLGRTIANPDLDHEVLGQPITDNQLLYFRTSVVLEYTGLDLLFSNLFRYPVGVIL
jgi:hypothetical protein